MADTTWVDKVTVYTVDWTQDANDVVYRGKNLVYAISTGAANVFTVTKLTNLKSAFEAGDEFEFKAHQSNTAGVSTFNFVTSVGTLSASISYAGSTTLTDGIITSGQIIKLTYDGTNMVLPYAGALSVDTAELKDHSVTYVKLQTVDSNSIVANPSGSPTTASDTPVVAPLAFSGGSLVNNTPLAQCRLTLSGSDLFLSEYGGHYIWINGRNESIPVGITHTISGASASTAYYIYVFMSGATMTLERSTTAWAYDTASGMLVKTGDATRTLVGLAYTDNPAAWVDSATKRWVLSYFNRRPKGMLNSFSQNRATSSGTYTEVNTEIRVQFISWADEVVQAWCDGSASGDANNVRSTTSLGLDSTTVAQDCVSNAQQGSGDSGLTLAVALTLPPQTVTEAVNHYITLLGHTSAGSSTWVGSGTAGARTTIKGTVIG